MGREVATLWDPIKIGEFELQHRLALAPMTRSRANRDGTPKAMAAEYYAQRASLGLLITEGTQPSDDGKGYPASPGIYTDAHIVGWRRVSDAVHAEGGRLFIQLMHVGRVSHLLNHPNEQLPVAPSAIAAPQPILTDEGYLSAPVPRALARSEIPEIQQEFAHAADCALRAGADGVELHGANGYLPWQFLTETANVRTDDYGGAIENRARFLLETTRLVANRIGAQKVGVRLSPNVNYLGLSEGPNWKDGYRHVLPELDNLGLAYIHLFYFGDEEFLREIRAMVVNTPILLVRAGRDIGSIERDLADGIAEMFPIATLAISNPDLVTRLKSGAELAYPDRKLYYGGDERGYTDYPSATGQAV